MKARTGSQRPGYFFFSSVAANLHMFLIKFVVELKLTNYKKFRFDTIPPNVIFFNIRVNETQRALRKVKIEEHLSQPFSVQWLRTAHQNGSRDQADQFFVCL